MTGQEELDALRAQQRKVHHQIHDIMNILTVFRGEVDLAINHARADLEAFYDRYPELRDS